MIAQGDGYPLLGLFPPQRWLPGEQIHDVRYITLPGDLDDEGVTLVVGWYDTATGERLKAFDQHGQPVPDDAFPLPP